MGYKKFFYVFLLIIAFFLFLCVALFICLNRIYEHNSYDEIVQHQIETNAVYGSALNENYFKYRLAMVKRIKPDILVIGNSRAGQFKSKFFNTSFLTTPNGSNTLREMAFFVDEVLKIYRPKVMILIVDPSDFNHRFPNFQRAKYQNISGTDIRFEKIVLPLKYLIERKISLDSIVGANKVNLLNGFNSMGIRAISFGEGSLPDGSYIFSSLYYGKKRSDDLQFSKSLKHVREGYYFFSWGDKIDIDRVREFENIVKKIENDGVDVVAITPPIAPTVYREMMDINREKFSYIKEVERLKKINFYFDPFLLHSNDCEFRDGTHPGEVTIARVLKAISEKDKVLKKYLNMNAINSTIEKYAGQVYAGTNPIGLHEVDFLNLGCKKH